MLSYGANLLVFLAFLLFASSGIVTMPVAVSDFHLLALRFAEAAEDTIRSAWSTARSGTMCISSHLTTS
jgi:hypothetical protein